jgi:hypothetical protein
MSFSATRKARIAADLSGTVKAVPFATFSTACRAVRAGVSSVTFRSAQQHNHYKILELMTGIEPVTSPLPRECSTN